MQMSLVTLLFSTAAFSWALAEEKFQKLTGAEIQAKFVGMELTDQVHWGDVYQRNGTLVTTEMGRKTAGTWRVQKDQLCLQRASEIGSGCYEVWLSGKNAQLRSKESNLPLEGVLLRPNGSN